MVCMESIVNKLTSAIRRRAREGSQKTANAILKAMHFPRAPLTFQCLLDALIPIII